MDELVASRAPIIGALLGHCTVPAFFTPCAYARYLLLSPKSPNPIAFAPFGWFSRLLAP